MSSALLTISAERVDGGVTKLVLDPDRRISRQEAGERCTPPVNRHVVRGYNQLAIKYLEKYRQPFYVWDRGNQVINFDLKIPETHLPVIQEIREEFYRTKNKAAVIQWIKNNKQYLESLIP